MKFIRLIKREILDLLAGLSFYFLRWVLKLYYISELDFLKKALEKAGVHPSLIKKPQILFKQPENLIGEPQKKEMPNGFKKKSVVYTCITNGYDKLFPPLYSSPNLDYVLFSNDPRMEIKGWKTVHLENTLQYDPIRLSRLPKVLPHRFLREYDKTIYIDGNFEIIGDLTELFGELQEAPIAVFKHPEGRTCIKEEAKKIIDLGKADPSLVQKQIEFYFSKGFPENFGLFECNIIIRNTFDPLLIETMEMWWQEIKNHSHRDLLSFPHVLWLTGLKVEVLPGNNRNNEILIREKHNL